MDFTLSLSSSLFVFNTNLRSWLNWIHIWNNNAGKHENHFFGLEAECQRRKKFFDSKINIRNKIFSVRNECKAHIAKIRLLNTNRASSVCVCVYLENTIFLNSDSNHCKFTILKSLWWLFQSTASLLSGVPSNDNSVWNVHTSNYWQDKKNVTTKLVYICNKKSDIRFGCDLVFNLIIKTNSIRFVPSKSQI